MNASSSQLRLVKSNALALIGDMRDCQKKFTTLSESAKNLSILPERKADVSDIAYIGQIAAIAADEEISLLRSESINDVKAKIDGKNPNTGSRRTWLGRKLNSLSAIVG